MGDNAFAGSGIKSIQYTQSGGNTLLRVDHNGDGIIDMEIQLNGTISLTESDFILKTASYSGDGSDKYTTLLPTTKVSTATTATIR